MKIIEQEYPETDWMQTARACLVGEPFRYWYRSGWNDELTTLDLIPPDAKQSFRLRFGGSAGSGIISSYPEHFLKFTCDQVKITEIGDDDVIYWGFGCAHNLMQDTYLINIRALLVESGLKNTLVIELGKNGIATVKIQVWDPIKVLLESDAILLGEVIP